jgi:hypothetical protein
MNEITQIIIPIVRDIENRATGLLLFGIISEIIPVSKETPNNDGANTKGNSDTPDAEPGFW